MIERSAQEITAIVQEQTDPAAIADKTTPLGKHGVTQPFGRSSLADIPGPTWTANDHQKKEDGAMKKWILYGVMALSCASALAMNTATVEARRHKGFGGDVCVALGLCTEEQADAADDVHEEIKRAFPIYGTFEEKASYCVRELPSTATDLRCQGILRRLGY